ncbi:hypothetical protein NHX12_029404 [Muraenolepis orangiensis]|uniref:Uncharacterized protein n=1 Tax=Muraenolepis orangiensis TaxID=630683 RepID=A0A9Q0EDN2_9TELE|nr:hypothetical protein NHX12_029404 [Muraenolepis orangiensis]
MSLRSLTPPADRLTLSHPPVQTHNVWPGLPEQRYPGVDPALVGRRSLWGPQGTEALYTQGPLRGRLASIQEDVLIRPSVNGRKLPGRSRRGEGL